MPFVALVLALLAISPHSQAADHALTRTEALRQLAGPETDARRQAALRLSEVGTMADVRALIARLGDGDEAVRELAEHAIWRIWSRSGDAAIDRQLELGTAQMGLGDFASAIETFTRIVETRPAFAEGWNKRATVYYLAGELERSLADCDQVMKRNPDHFGALAGYGLIYARLDRPERALEYFERALAINPNLRGAAANAAALRELLRQRGGRTI